MTDVQQSSKVEQVEAASLLTQLQKASIFAGVSLEGSTIRPDNDANERIYGSKIPAKELVLTRDVAVPPSAQDMISILNTRTPVPKR